LTGGLPPTYDGVLGQFLRRQLVRNFLLLGVLLAAVVSLNAQSSDSSAKPAKGSGKDWDLVTLNGCLGTVTGHYMLTEDNGTSHELTGAARKLKSAVGHQIKLIGRPGVRTVSTTATGIASSVVEFPVFEVKTLQSIGDTCNAPAK
jgi:hypothetical protein